MGELDGVIFKEAPGPASLDFALRGAVVAIGEESGSPERAGSSHFRSRAFVIGPDQDLVMISKRGAGRRGGGRKVRWNDGSTVGVGGW